MKMFKHTQILRNIPVLKMGYYLTQIFLKYYFDYVAPLCKTLRY